MEARTMFGSKTIIADDDRLPNVHPGEILREEFLIGSEIPVADVAAAALVEPARLDSILAGLAAIDADIDLRLARYFGMSEGFFLRLQLAHDLEAVRRTRGAEIATISPRIDRAA
jgi:addiction module HigA family antidote